MLARHEGVRPRRLHLPAAAGAPVPAREVPARARGRRGADGDRGRATPGRRPRRSSGSRTRPSTSRGSRAAGCSRREELALGLPWSPELVERARRSVGATLQAADAALADGVAANLGGGTHHAFPDGGRGFCVFNDVVVARRGRCARAGRLRRVLVVDLDVHQGDGTHAAFMDDAEAFTFSVNGFAQLPVPARSRRPRARPRRTEPGTSAYLEGSLGCCRRRSPGPGPTLCFYLAGADPYEGDRLGRLALTRAAAWPRATGSSATRSAAPASRSASRSPAATPTRSRTPSRINLDTLRTIRREASPS